MRTPLEKHVTDYGFGFTRNGIPFGYLRNGRTSQHEVMPMQVGITAGNRVIAYFYTPVQVRKLGKYFDSTPVNGIPVLVGTQTDAIKFLNSFAS